MKKASDLFNDKETWILDGGLATELEKRGVDLNHELWSAKALKENPEAIYETHLSYLEAGADILLTASYQASIKGFEKYGMYNREARETIFSSVMLATYAREKYFETNPKRPILIGGSCGPYGAYLADGSEYTGAYFTDQDFESKLAAYYHDKIEVLLSPRKNYRIDFLMFETLPLAQEAQLILSHMRKYSGAPVVFSFSRIDAALQAARLFAKEPQVAALGLNCMSVENIIKALPQLAPLTEKPLMVYPNGGGSYDAKTKKWAPHEPVDWKALNDICDRYNVKIRGGCCRTAPSDIAELRNLTQTSN